MRGAVLACAAVLWAAASAAGAQEAAAEPVLRSPVLIIDQDRLFAESQIGAAALERIEDEALALAAENRRIEAELLDEERALTELRPQLAVAEFTERANAFDEKVQRLRSEQDAKSRALARDREQAQAAFLGEIGGVLSDIARERGALVMLDRRQVFLSVDAIDVTDEAIERINEALGSEGPAQ